MKRWRWRRQNINIFLKWNKSKEITCLLYKGTHFLYFMTLIKFTINWLNEKLINRSINNINIQLNQLKCCFSCFLLISTVGDGRPWNNLSWEKKFWGELPVFTRLLQISSLILQLHHVFIKSVWEDEQHLREEKRSDTCWTVSTVRVCCLISSVHCLLFSGLH